MLIKKIIAPLFLVFSLSGCSFLYDTFVYQIDVTQGNYIDDEKVDQVKIGMTQEQVIFILGSPMLIDQFDSSKWYYIRYIKPGAEEIQQHQVLLVFDNKVLVSMEREDEIENNPLLKSGRKKAPKPSTESSKGDTGEEARSPAPIIED
ncbi:outer membrane protein assembly factor BamE [Psychromonas aquimarina]|uniref:outer membrane protein assembly factor BamE n=1 Tax=Psychromonas aquimarina TaxID=444919 RepID=UPI000429B3F1|nr:outer membrane protein assembly factor BamE [Psychromonas aquimarina]